VIEQATGMPADAYATEVLFEPLGLDRAEWWRGRRGPHAHVLLLRLDQP
jgi:CubicO group peptidase (beta-lactamase class C family)